MTILSPLWEKQTEIYPNDEGCVKITNLENKIILYLNLVPVLIYDADMLQQLLAIGALTVYFESPFSLVSRKLKVGIFYICQEKNVG